MEREKGERKKEIPVLRKLYHGKSFQKLKNK